MVSFSLFRTFPIVHCVSVEAGRRNFKIWSHLIYQLFCMTHNSCVISSVKKSSVQQTTISFKSTSSSKNSVSLTKCKFNVASQFGKFFAFQFPASAICNRTSTFLFLIWLQLAEHPHVVEMWSFPFWRP